MTHRSSLRMHLDRVVELVWHRYGLRVQAESTRQETLWLRIAYMDRSKNRRFSGYGITGPCSNAWNVARRADSAGGNDGTFSGRNPCPCLCFSGLFCIISILR